MMKDKFAEQEMLNERILERLDEIKEQGQSTHQKLFVGNGEPALARKVDRHDLMLTAIFWLLGTIGIAVVGLCANAAAKIF